MFITVQNDKFSAAVKNCSVTRLLSWRADCCTLWFHRCITLLSDITRRKLVSEPDGLMLSLRGTGRPWARDIFRRFWVSPDGQPPNISGWFWVVLDLHWLCVPVCPTMLWVALDNVQEASFRVVLLVFFLYFTNCVLFV